MLRLPHVALRMVILLRMTVLPFTFLFASLLFASGTLHAQEPAKIADQYVKAVGGSKALSKIQTMTLEGSFTNTADGKSGTYTLDTKLPNRY